jgi:hypothetical protein
VSKYKPNHRSFEEFMLSRQIKSPVREIAELIKADAAANTPVKTGDLAGSYEVNDVTPVVAGGNPRAAYEVRNSDPAAAPQEFGNVHVKGQRMLGKAASRYGDQVGEKEGI